MGKACKNIPGIIIIYTEKNIAHDVYNAETNLTPLYAWEKNSNSRGSGKIFLPKLNHPYPTPPEKSNGQPHRGWERRRFCTLVDVIMWWFSRPNFRILSLKIRRWHKWKEKVQKNAQITFCGRQLFAMKLFFEEFNLVLFAADQRAWLVLNQPRQRGFWRNVRYFLHSMVKDSTSFKGNFCIYKGFMDVFYI